MRRDFGSLFSFLKKYLQAIPASLPPGTPEVWNLDHRFALAGMQNTRLVRSMCEAFATVMREYAPEYAADLIEDFAVRIGNESRV